MFVIAFCIRLIALNQSLWLDEATTAKVVKSFSYLGILTKFSTGDFHPPLYYFFIKFWSTFFGYSEIALRMPSVLFSLVTGWILYKIGKQLKDEKLGMWTAVFFLFNPLIVYYSQEARMYMMATCFLSISLLFFINILNIKHQKSKRQIKYQNLNNILFNLFVGLSFLTFYGSIFFIAAIYVYIIYKKDWRLLTELIPGMLIAGIVISPLLLQQFQNSRLALSSVANWKQVLGTTSLKNLLLFPLKFSFGRISFKPKIMYYALSGLWSAIIFFLAIRGGLKKNWLLFLFFVPILLGLIFSIFSPLLQYFRFLYLIVPLSIMLATTLYKQKFAVFILLGFFILCLVYLLNPSFYREDWKTLSKELPKHIPVYMILSSSDPVLYYRQDISIQDLKNLKNIDTKEIVVIPYTSDIHGVNYEKNFKTQSYVLDHKKAYKDLYVEHWLHAGLL